MATHAQKQLHTKLKAVMQKLHNAYSRVYAQESFDRRQKTLCIPIATVWQNTTSRPWHSPEDNEEKWNFTHKLDITEEKIPVDLQWSLYILFIIKLGLT
jgi:hypothetical protein